MKKIILIIIGLVLFNGCFKINIENSFKDRQIKIINGNIFIKVYGVKESKKNYILYDTPYSIVIKTDENIE